MIYGRMRWKTDKKLRNIESARSEGRAANDCTGGRSKECRERASLPSFAEVLIDKCSVRRARATRPH
eukprot:683746-Prymnesium_polylepis.1